jgi:hypothetical protein
VEKNVKFENGNNKKEKEKEEEEFHRDISSKCMNRRLIYLYLYVCIFLLYFIFS